MFQKPTCWTNKDWFPCKSIFYNFESRGLKYLGLFSCNQYLYPGPQTWKEMYSKLNHELFSSMSICSFKEWQSNRIWCFVNFLCDGHKPTTEKYSVMQNPIERFWLQMWVKKLNNSKSSNLQDLTILEQHFREW